VTVRVRALVSGFVGVGGVPVLLAEGEERAVDEQVVLAHPHLFTEPPAPRGPRLPRGRAGQDRAGADE